MIHTYYVILGVIFNFLLPNFRIIVLTVPKNLLLECLTYMYRNISLGFRDLSLKAFLENLQRMAKSFF